MAMLLRKSSSSSIWRSINGSSSVVHFGKIHQSSSSSIKGHHHQTRLLSNDVSIKEQLQQQQPQQQIDQQEDDWFNKITEEDIDERIVPKPISTMPDHLGQTRKRQMQKPWWKFRYFVDIHTKPLDTEEYSVEPQYPPIYDTSTEGTRKQIRLEWYKAIQRLPSAQQKIYEITKHYGHFSYFMDMACKQYNMLPVQQAITRTRLIHSLPDAYTTTSNTTPVDDRLKQAILKVITNRLYGAKTRKISLDFKRSNLSQFGFLSNSNAIQSINEEDILVDVVQTIRNYIMTQQNCDQSSLANIQLDYNPYVATSWWVNDYPIPFKKTKWFHDRTHIDQCFLYKSKHALHARGETPLAPIVSPTDDVDNDLCDISTVPDCKYNLLKLGTTLRRHNILSLPGFWPDESNGFDFPYLIGHTREICRARQECNAGSSLNDTQDVLDGMAIMSSFAWLTSLANNLGFTIYDRLTYPLVTNVVITDGQYWSFYVYQLNNHCFHSDIDGDGSDKLSSVANICWSSGDMKLFDSYQDDGTVVNVNEQVLATLVKILTPPIMQQSSLSSQNLRPYISVDDRSEVDKAELNYSLRRKFANTTDNYVARRKKTNLWETVYKNHKDSPVDVKRIRPKLDFKYPPFFK